MTDDDSVADAVNQIRRLEARRFAAMTARDLDELEVIFDDRLLYTHSSGVRDTKADYLYAVRAETYVYGPIAHAETTITVLGDAAVVSGEMRADITVEGKPKTLRNASTAVWSRTGGGWRLLSYQTTPLPSA